MKIVFSTDAQAGIKATTEAEKRIAAGLTAAMKEAGNKAAAAANAQIHGAGFQSRKWEMRAKYLSSGNTLLPEIWLHSRVNFEDVFEEGRVINVKKRKWLWIPLPSVPSWPGDPTRQMSPQKYIQTVGPLTFMRRQGKPPLLGAPVSGNLKPQPFGRFVTKARLRKGRTGKGPVTMIPLFVGVPTVTIAKRFDVEGAVESVVKDLPFLYIQNETPGAI